jgi:hypothetical protein
MLSKLSRFIEENFLALCLFNLAWVIVDLTVSYFRHKSRGRFIAEPPEGSIIHRECWVSGRSLRSPLTRLGGAKNSLKVVVTFSHLLITPVFPFWIRGPDIDLFHNIPVGSIESVERREGIFRDAFRIRINGLDNTRREIEIYPKKPDAFEAAINCALRESRVSAGVTVQPRA